MSYTGTKAAIGKGLKLQINTGTASSPTWVTVGESLEMTLASKMLTEEATNFDSSATEYIGTLADGGEIKFSCNRVSSDAGQVAMQAAGPMGAGAGLFKSFQAIAPLAVGQTSLGDTWTWNAIVTEFNPAFKPDKKTSMSGVMRTTNGVVYTEGS